MEDVFKKKGQTALAFYADREDDEGDPVGLTKEIDKTVDHILGTTGMMAGVNLLEERDLTVLDDAQSLVLPISFYIQATDRARNSRERIVKIPASSFTKEVYAPDLEAMIRAANAHLDDSDLDILLAQYLGTDPSVRAIKLSASDKDVSLIVSKHTVIAAYYKAKAQYLLQNFEALCDYGRLFGVQFVDRFTEEDKLLEDRGLSVAEYEDQLIRETRDDGRNLLEETKAKDKSYKERFKGCKAIKVVESLALEASSQSEKQYAQKVLKVYAKESHEIYGRCSVTPFRMSSLFSLTEAAMVTLSIESKGFDRLSNYIKASRIFGETCLYEELHRAVKVGYRYSIKAFAALCDKTFPQNAPHISSRDNMKSFIKKIKVRMFKKDGKELTSFVDSVFYIEVVQIELFHPLELISEADYAEGLKASSAYKRLNIIEELSPSRPQLEA